MRAYDTIGKDAIHIILSLAIRQGGAQSSALITHIFPERRKSRKRKETHSPSLCFNERMHYTVFRIMLVLIVYEDAYSRH